MTKEQVAEMEKTVDIVLSIRRIPPEFCRDCRQTIFLKICTHITKYDPVKGKFITWVSTVAANQINTMKSQNKKYVNDVGLSDDISQVTSLSFQNVIALKYDIESRLRRMKIKEENKVIYRDWCHGILNSSPYSFTSLGFKYDLSNERIRLIIKNINLKMKLYLRT